MIKTRSQHFGFLFAMYSLRLGKAMNFRMLAIYKL